MTPLSLRRWGHVSDLPGLPMSLGLLGQTVLDAAAIDIGFDFAIDVVIA